MNIIATCQNLKHAYPDAIVIYHDEGSYYRYPGGLIIEDAEAFIENTVAEGYHVALVSEEPIEESLQPKPEIRQLSLF